MLPGSISSGASRPTRDPVAPLRRCCPSHQDWAILSAHLREDFPRATPADIAAELRLAYEAVDRVKLQEDALLIAELIARYRLLVRVGDLAEVARLDPQSHAMRSA